MNSHLTATAMLNAMQAASQGNGAGSEAALYQQLRQAHAAAQAGQAVGGGPDVISATPGSERRFTVHPDGRMTMVGPDGGTTISYPDGRTTHIGPDGHIESTGVPGMDEHPIPQQVQDMTVAFLFTAAFIAVGLPIARAFGRRIDRSKTRPGVGADFPPDLGERMDRIEHAVDSIAVEVERISEGQRFTTKLMSEMRPLAQQLPAGAHPEAAPVRREPAAAVPVSDRRS